MAAQYDQVNMMIGERLEAIANERVANEARRARVAETRRLREMAARVGGALAGVGSALTDHRRADERRPSVRRTA
jgi:hypothetical protein